MANVSNGITEKMKAFCREYVVNGGNGTQAYLTAYNSNSESAASIESSKLLRRDDITQYIAYLNKPIENRIQNEREKKRQWLWDMINNPNTADSDKLRAMDILNKVDAEYLNINVNRTESTVDLNTIDIDSLKAIIQ